MGVLSSILIHKNLFSMTFPIDCFLSFFFFVTLIGEKKLTLLDSFTCRKDVIFVQYDACAWWYLTSAPGNVNEVLVTKGNWTQDTQPQMPSGPAHPCLSHLYIVAVRKLCFWGKRNVIGSFLSIKWILALTGVVQLVGCCFTKWKVVGQFPVRAHAWIGGSVHGQGAYGWQPINVCISHWYFSPSLSPSHPLSLKVNKIFYK